MTLEDLTKWKEKKFSTWVEFAKHIGYSPRQLEKIRKGDQKISAKIELLWMKDKRTRSSVG